MHYWNALVQGISWRSHRPSWSMCRSLTRVSALFVMHNAFSWHIIQPGLSSFLGFTLHLPCYTEELWAHHKWLFSGHITYLIKLVWQAILKIFYISNQNMVLEGGTAVAGLSMVLASVRWVAAVGLTSVVLYSFWSSALFCSFVTQHFKWTQLCASCRQDKDFIFYVHDKKKQIGINLWVL